MAGGDQDLGRARLRLETDPTGMSRGMQVARAEALSSVKGIQQSLTAAGASMSNTGRQMTAGITLPIVAAGAAIFNVGKNFEETLNQIVGLTDVSRDELGKIKDDITAIAEETGRAPQELAEAFYFVASAGFNAAEATDVLRTSAIASAAGLGRTQDIAKVLGLTINAYGKENITASRAADILTAAVKDGTAEADAFAGVLGRVVPTAATLGVTFDQVTAALAAMTLTGLSADEAATSLNQVFTSLLKPTREAEAAMADMGLSAQGLRTQLREEGLLATLRTLEERFGANEEAASLVFGNVRALRGVLSLLTLDADQLNKVFNDTAVAQGDLADGYRETEGTARDQERAQARIQAQLIRLSEDVMPVVIEMLEHLADGVEDVTDWFTSLDPATRGVVVQVAALAALAGPMLVFAGSMVTAAGAMGKLIIAAGPLLPLFAVVADQSAEVTDALERQAAGTSLADQAFEDLGREHGWLQGPLRDLATMLGLISDEAPAAGGATAAFADDSVDAAERLRAGVVLPVAEVKDAYTGLGTSIADYRKKQRDELDKAIADQRDYSSQALAELQGFRTAIESAYSAAQDAALDFSRTSVAIAQKQIELSKLDEEHAKNAGKWTKVQVAEWKLRRQETVAEINALKLHLALIGDDIARTSKLKSLLASKEMKDGLTSKMPETRAAYEALRAEAIAELNRIATKGGPASRDAAREVAKYMNPNNPISPLHNAAAWGRGIGNAYIGGLSAAVSNTTRLRIALQKVGGFMESGSPPRDPTNPLHPIDRWGRAAGESWLSPFVGAIAGAAGLLRGPLGDAAALLMAPMSGPGLAMAAAGAGVGAPGGFARNVPSLPAQASDAAKAAAGGGDTFNLYLPDARHTDPWAVLDRVPRYAKQAKAAAAADGWRPAS